VVPGLTEVLTALDPMLTALDPTEGMPMLAALGRVPMLTDLNPTGSMAFLTATALDPAEGMSMLKILDPTDPMPMLMALDPMPMLTTLDPMSTLTALDPIPMLMALDPTDCMAFLTVPDPAERMAFLTAPDPTAGLVEVGRRSVPGQERDLNLCPMGCHVLAPASPLAKGESCPSLSTPGSAEEWHLNLRPSLLTPCSAEADSEQRDLDPLATLGHAASAPAPTDSQSRTTPGSAAYSSCLPSSSTTHPMGSNASVTQLSHPRLSLVLIQEPRVQS
jgi:hypothetical protein